MEDEKIIELYWQRSPQAIDETSRKYGAYCMRLSMNILMNREDSEENVNDTYLRTWNAIPPQRPQFFAAFLGRIARNLALNRYKAGRGRSGPFAGGTGGMPAIRQRAAG